MTNTPDVEATVERGKREILADVRSSLVPVTVASFSELHDYVDANGYGGAFEDGAPDPCEFCDFWNEVQNRIDQWIKSGAIRRTVGK
jgi:hypothetical protein